jgi:hypothetical protein
LAQLVHAETITKGHIEFDIKRALVNGKITKHITFLDKRIPYHYTEEVAALRYDEIIQMMTEVGFQIVDSFGSYQLTPFDKIESKRLILMLKK